METSELLRRLNNIVQIGTICQVEGKKALVKVDILGRETPWLPLISQAGFFLKSFLPPRVGEQVLVFCPAGDADFGFALRGVFFKGLKEPLGAGSAQASWQVEDGSQGIYDTAKDSLNALFKPDAFIEFAKNLKVTLQEKLTLKTTSGLIVIESGDLIELKNQSTSLLALSEALLDLLKEFQVLHPVVGVSRTHPAAIAKIEGLRAQYQSLLK